MTKHLQMLAATLLLGFFSLPAFTQWTQRQSLTGVSRTFATGFTVDSTIYVMGGYDGNQNLFNDVWAYDPLTDTWTQKGNFPGGNRTASSAFTIGSKAYMGTGTDGNDYLKDFWEYEPATDTWMQKADFPGYEREEAVGFSIGSKGYMGTGQVFVITPNFSFTETFNDFFEYDPATDSWSPKDSLPGPTRAYAVGAVIGNKGYLGLGGNDDQSASYTDFYEYDPIADQWTAKAPMGGTGRADAGIVANGNNIYVIGGINFPSFSGYSSIRMYDVLTDTWSAAPGFNGGVIIAPVAQNAAGRVFAGTGYNSGLGVRNDWWEFTSLSASISTANNEQPVVFPSPFSDELNIQLKNSTGEIQVALFDIKGRKVYSEQQVLLGKGEIKVNTLNLSNEIYLLRITNRAGENILTEKILKN